MNSNRSYTSLKFRSAETKNGHIESSMCPFLLFCLLLFDHGNRLGFDEFFDNAGRHRTDLGGL